MSFGMRLSDTFICIDDGVRYEAEDYTHKYLADYGEQECTLTFRQCDNNVEHNIIGVGILRADATQDAFKNALVKLRLKCK